MSSVVIVGAKRTPLGALLGQFTGVPATTLGATPTGAGSPAGRPKGLK
jgi:acetyl-CoA C-acetyltransferase